MIVQRQRSGKKAGWVASVQAATGQRSQGVWRSGYTLVEMIVAVIVAGVLLSIGVPRFSQSLEQSLRRRGGAQPEVDLVRAAALLAAKPYLRSRSEHAAFRQPDRSFASHDVEPFHLFDRRFKR